MRGLSDRHQQRGIPQGLTAKQSNSILTLLMLLLPQVLSAPQWGLAVFFLGSTGLPAGFGAWLRVAIQSPLPDTISQSIAHRSHDREQLRRPVVEVQGTDSG